MANQHENKESPDLVALWKFIGIFALVFLAVQLTVAFFSVGVNYLMRWISAGENLRTFLGNTVSRAGMIAATILITAPVIRTVLKKNSREILYPFEKGWKRDLAIGLLLSTAVMSLIFFLEIAFGWLQVDRLALAGEPLLTWIRRIWLALLVNLTVAVGGEVLFRGLLLTGLKETWDEGGAIFVSSIIFAASHLLISNSAQTGWLSFVPMLALPGVMLGWAYLRTGNLWLATGIHFAWNIFQDDILNLTGNLHGNNLFGLATTVSAPEWFIGNSYGIEIGLAGILAAVLVIAGTWFTTRKMN
jgi:membrane protease YdiL (CAAX protease family)